MTTDKKTATKRARERYRELEARHERRCDGLATDVTVGEVFARYATDKLPRKAPGTQRTYLECLKPLREYFVGQCRNPAVEKVRKGHVEGSTALKLIRLCLRESKRYGGYASQWTLCSSSVTTEIRLTISSGSTLTLTRKMVTRP